MCDYLLKCEDWPFEIDCPIKGQYLESYDPEQPHDAVLSTWTADPSKAKHFHSTSEALREWRRQRMYDGGLRPDGEPDRPLTAFTISVEPAPELDYSGAPLPEGVHRDASEPR